MLAGMLHLASEIVAAGKIGDVGHSGHAGSQYQLRGFKDEFLAISIYYDCPRLGGFVESGGLASGSGPVIQLHDSRVAFQPVANLVLGREHRPMIRERQIGQVIVPDRIV